MGSESDLKSPKFFIIREIHLGHSSRDLGSRREMFVQPEVFGNYNNNCADSVSLHSQQLPRPFIR